MLRIPIICLWMAIFSLTACGVGEESSEQASDSTSVVSDSITGNEMLNPDRDQAMLISNLAEQYSPEELYIELVKRSDTIQSKPFDSIPVIIQKNFSRSELEAIFQRTRALERIPTATLIGAYQLKGNSRNKSWVMYDELIYDTDDRKEVTYNPDDLSEQSTPNDNGKCVGVLISRIMLARQQDGSYKFRFKRMLKDRYSLCSTEAFTNQPSYADATAFVIGERQLLTASHCFETQNFSDKLVVFDYIHRNGELRERVEEKNVYEIERIRRISDSIPDIDLCIIRTKKVIPKERVRELEANPRITQQSKWFVIGSPLGLPLKIVENASMIPYNNLSYFSLNCDTYEGNSGSPIFSAATKKIEGMIVKGFQDFNVRTLLDNSHCRVSILCPKEGCGRGETRTGEKAIRSNVILNFINHHQ